ncbi:Uncharacterized protein dnm_006630 [Desulfonema magnum]|uniref:Uncharacterized protein n=1 Tax=Desulfonema magnum TaxID=45655 RepID=A0A975BF91_9BACT|nr:Uncharacterized protein dnm_006630 [Desulfonema magnum]
MNALFLQKYQVPENLSPKLEDIYRLSNSLKKTIRLREEFF